jgi:hypothetical protein
MRLPFLGDWVAARSIGDRFTLLDQVAQSNRASAAQPAEAPSYRSNARGGAFYVPGMVNAGRQANWEVIQPASIARTMATRTTTTV